jgi:hypothetical protein
MIQKVRQFLKDNPVSSFILFCSVLYSLFWPNETRWFSWELAGFISTVAYSFYIYIFEGMICGSRFMLQKKRKDKIGWVVLCIVSLSITALLSLNNHTHLINIPSALHLKELIEGYPTSSKMALLFISTLLFAKTVHMLGSSGSDKVARSFKSSFVYSDRPICIGFALLFAYSLIVGESYIAEKQMHSFFGGAIALQMMISNIVWVFNDDDLLQCARKRNQLHNNSKTK